MSLPVSPCRTNRLKPTGGVICAISTTSTMKMPNHSRSIPAALTEGRITAEVSTTMEMPSRKQPRTMKSSVSTRIRWPGVSPWRAIQSAIARGIPVKPIATVRKAAPVSMKAIMQDVFIAPMTLALNAFRSSDPVASRVEFFAEARDAVARRGLCRVEQGPAGDVAGEEQHQHDPRQHARDEQPRDRYVGRDAVHDHDDRGRDEEAERAGAGERADRHALVVAPLLQLRDRDLSDGGCGCRGGARDRGEDAAAEDIAVHQPARERRHPRRESPQHVLGNAAAEQDLAHPDE